MHGAAARDRRRKRHDATVRLHQEALLRAQAGRVQSFVKMTDVVHHHRLEVGVEQGGGESRPFANARQDLARQRDVDGGTFLLDQRPRFLLVHRIHERKEVADGDRLDVGVLELARGAANGVLVDRAEYASGVVAALGNFLGEALRRDGGRLRIEIIEQVAVARLVLNFLHRAVALRNEQSDLGAAHLQQRIGGDGGAVSEKTDVSGRDALGNESAEPLEHAQRGIFRRARDLLDREFPRRGVEQHEISVGAAHIHAEPVTRMLSHHGRARHGKSGLPTALPRAHDRRSCPRPAFSA